MGNCIKCGTNFVGTPENPPADALCKYCEIDRLKAEVERLTMELNAATTGEYTKQDVAMDKMHKALNDAEKYIAGVNADWPKGMDDDRDELLARIANAKL